MKLLNTLGIAVVLLLVASAASAQVIKPRGVTELEASQLVGWVGRDDEEVDNNQLGSTLVQVTNSGDDDVTVHVQIWASEDGTGDPVTDPCLEIDFTDTYTPKDTHTYDLEEIVRNQNACNNGGSCSTEIDLEGSGLREGFFTVTPVVSPTDRRAISYNHMFGQFLIDHLPSTSNDERHASGDVVDLGGENVTGRLAVSFVTGGPLPAGTILDGVTGGFEVLQPEILSFNFHRVISEELDDMDWNSLTGLLIFADNYSGPFGDYRSEPADATFDTLIFNEAEVPTSCQSITATCIAERSVNDVFESEASNDLLLCPGNTLDNGWVRLAVTGLDGLENVVGLIMFGEEESSSFANLRNMYAQGSEVVPTPTPAPTPEPTATPTPDGGTPTGGGTPGGGGGGGGCAIAGPVQASTALANMLIVLLPAVGFALRRRFNK